MAALFGIAETGDHQNRSIGVAHSFRPPDLKIRPDSQIGSAVAQSGQI